MTNKFKVFFKAMFYPIQDSFFVWWEVIQGNELPIRFWEDISFFHLFNEDFFEWYDFDITHWKFLDD